MNLFRPIVCAALVLAAPLTARAQTFAQIKVTKGIASVSVNGSTLGSGVYRAPTTAKVDVSKLVKPGRNRFGVTPIGSVLQGEMRITHSANGKTRNLATVRYRGGGYISGNTVEFNAPNALAPKGGASKPTAANQTVVAHRLVRPAYGLQCSVNGQTVRVGKDYASPVDISAFVKPGQNEIAFSWNQGASGAPLGRVEILHATGKGGFARRHITLFNGKVAQGAPRFTFSLPDGAGRK